MQSNQEAENNMAITREANVQQALAEAPRQWDFDFNPDLPTGITVSSATATHVPPSGSAGTVAVGTIAAGIVPVKLTLGSLVTGKHYLICLATFSNGDDSSIRLVIQVDY
jgi:hypothetical protein